MQKPGADTQLKCHCGAALRSNGKTLNDCSKCSGFFAHYTCTGRHSLCDKCVVKIATQEGESIIQRQDGELRRLKHELNLQKKNLEKNQVNSAYQLSEAQTKLLAMEKKLSEEINARKALCSQLEGKEEMARSNQELVGRNLHLQQEMDKVNKDKKCITEQLQALAVRQEESDVDLQEVYADRKRTAEEEERYQKYEQESWLACYDMVILSDRFPTLVQGGWKVLHKKTSLGIENTMTRFPIAAVLGDFDSGKSYTMNNVAAAGFVAGDTIHTPGLCFKMYHDKYFDSLIMVDTQGWNSPVDDVSEPELHYKKLEEEFLRGVAFDVADIFIYVVNHISAKEQQEICGLSADLERCTEDTSMAAKHKVIVLHNLRTVHTQKEFDIHTQKIRTMYKEVTTLKNQTVTIPGGGEASVEWLDGRVLPGSDTPSHMSYQCHFIIGKEGTEAGRNNDAVFTRIKEMIRGYQPHEGEIRLKNRVLSACNRQLEGACTSASKKPDLVFHNDDDDTLWLKSEAVINQDAQFPKSCNEGTAPPPPNNPGFQAEENHTSSQSPPMKSETDSVGTTDSEGINGFIFKKSTRPSYILGRGSTGKNQAEGHNHLIVKHGDQLTLVCEMPGCFYLAKAEREKLVEKGVTVPENTIIFKFPKPNVCDIVGASMLPAVCGAGVGVIVAGSLRAQNFPFPWIVPEGHKFTSAPKCENGLLVVTAVEDHSVPSW